ncbi:MAG: hypothetical protein LUH00_02995 [Lachnospiraceae bacterium]|nr:hypothetical protein [Lachnospiraceae bacterium]
MNYDTWKIHDFSTGITSGDDYKKFQRNMRSDLRKQAADNHMVIQEFSGSHYEFSAILKSETTGKLVFVSISDVRFFKNQWFNHVLFRRMKDEKDYSGGNNHFCSWPEIGRKAAQLAS